MTGDHRDDRRGILTIVDNVLTVNGSARGKERACRPHSQSGGLPKKLEGVRKMAWRQTLLRHSGGSESAAKNTLTLLGPTLNKAKNKCGSIFICFIFIEVFRELSTHSVSAPLGIEPESLMTGSKTGGPVEL